MWVPMLLATLFLSGATGTEHLRNGDFEEVAQDAPAAWALYVAPAEGAFGRHEAEGGMDGGGAVMLHTPLPYAEDPLNNWSQVIEGPFDGGEWHFRGAIRSREATEAFHLIQAWQRRPGRVLQTESTRQDIPFSGTNDWTMLETTFTPPRGTDFLVVRCVLMGVGSAWFDQCSLRSIAPETEKAEKADSTTETSAGTETVPTRVAQPKAEMEALEKQLETMRDAGEGMRGDVQRLRDTNDALRQQLELMRGELQHLQDTLRRPMPELPELPTVPQQSEAQEPPTTRPPPLRPRLWEGEL